MKKLSLYFVLLVFASCNLKPQPKPLAGEDLALYNRTVEQVATIEGLLCEVNGMQANEALQLYALASELQYTYDYQSLDSASQVKCAMLQERIENLKTNIQQTIKDNLDNIHVSIYHNEDCLLEKKTTYPVYLKRGEKLHVNISTKRAATVKVYNYDAKSTIKTLSETTKFNFTINIENAAIYLVEVNPGSASQYAHININYTTNNLARLTPAEIGEREVEAKSGEFRAWSVKGVKMKNLLEEPRKFTLRGQLKAMFSGAYRGVVAVEVPAGATDILYSMRISTNERDRSSDGEFNEHANATYRKIKMLGLPVYESTKSAGIINTILGDYTPLREEDAYINMFVFRSSSQAKKFQDNKPTNQLSYDINSSIMGMQSCTGRIPVKGRQTIYLGFENERTRYNNYVWVELLALQPNTEYFKTEYFLK